MSRSNGFSLLDLLITLAIASILITSGAGTIRLLRDTFQTVEVNTFVSLLNMARSAAITRQRDIVFCPSSDGRRCSAATDFTWWHNGALLFSDDNGNHKLDTTDVVLRWHVPDDAQLRIKSSRHRSRVVYQPNGFAGGSNITFTICGKRAAANATGRYIVVSNTGRARVAEKPAGGQADQREETCA